MTRKYDFHMVDLDTAIRTIEQLISDVRLRGASETFEFVTGHGIIKYQARELLETQYGFTISAPITSPSFTVLVE